MILVNHGPIWLQSSRITNAPKQLEWPELLHPSSLSFERRPVLLGTLIMAPRLSPTTFDFHLGFVKDVQENFQDFLDFGMRSHRSFNSDLFFG
jgi:hypothetical protein